MEPTMRKDAEGGLTTEPEVVNQVLAEIKGLGENTKKNYDELRKSHETLKSIVDRAGSSMTGEIQAQVKRLADDIATRQENLDKTNASISKRLDQIEIALARPGLQGPNDFGSSTTPEEVRTFLIETMASKANGQGVTYDQLEERLANFDSQQYRDYQKVFCEYARKGDRLMGPDKLKLLQVGSDPDGGITVTPAMSAKIIERLYELDPIRELASIETITTDSIEYQADWGDAGAEWVGETVPPTDVTTPTTSLKKIFVHELATRPRATQKLLEDSGINIEAWLAKKIGNRFGRTEASAFVTGNGVAKPKGFLTYANGTAWGQVEQVGMGAAAVLTADGFIKVKYALKEFFLTRGTWLMQRSTVSSAMQLKDGTGAYIWKPGLKDDATSTILGLPVRMSPTMPTVAANALSVVLAEWSEFYIIVDRLGITVQRDPYTVKPLVEFYTRKRVGGDVANFEAGKIGIISV